MVDLPGGALTLPGSAPVGQSADYDTVAGGAHDFNQRPLNLVSEKKRQRCRLALHEGKQGRPIAPVRGTRSGLAECPEARASIAYRRFGITSQLLPRTGN